MKRFLLFSLHLEFFNTQYIYLRIPTHTYIKWREELVEIIVHISIILYSTADVLEKRERVVGLGEHIGISREGMM